MLVGVSFLSLALCQGTGAFHKVDMVQMRLGPRGKAVSALVFDLLSFAYIALTNWYFVQFVLSSYRREALASTTAGHAALDTGDGDGGGRHDAADRPGQGRDRRRAEAPAVSESFEVVIVLVIFLGLLAAGMAIPFAIGVPAIAYLLLHGGVPALKGIGLMSWGSMNNSVPQRHPAVHPDGRDHAAIRTQLPDISRPGQAGERDSGRPAADQHRRLRDVRGDFRFVGGDRGRHRHRGAAAAHPARVPSPPGGGLAGGGRHARHPGAALDRPDRLRHLHRNLRLQAVHGRHRAGHAADGDVHGLYLRARPAQARDRAARKRAAEPRGVRDGVGRPVPFRRS